MTKRKTPAPMPVAPKVERLLTTTQVAAKLGISKRTIFAHLSAGKFPPAMRLGPRIIRWSESSIDAYIVNNEQSTTA